MLLERTIHVNKFFLMGDSLSEENSQVKPVFPEVATVCLRKLFKWTGSFFKQRQLVWENYSTGAILLSSVEILVEKQKTSL